MEIQANLSDSIQILPENQGTLSLLLKILGHHLTPRFSTIYSAKCPKLLSLNILTFAYSFILALA